MNRREAKVGVLACFAFIIAFPAAVGGGLLIAPLVALTAMTYVPLQPISWRSVRWAWPFIPAALFLVWACISYLWSSHDDAEQIPKTLLGLPLYAIFAWRVGGLEGVWKRRAEACLVFFVLATGCMMLFEAVTGGQGTMSFKIGAEGFDPEQDTGLVEQVYRSLGHGAAPFVLIGGPAVALIWARGHKRLAALAAGLILFAAFSFEMSVNAVAVLLASLVTALASFRPRLALSLVFTGLAGFLVVMPLLMPGLISILPDSFTSNLPVSWSWRLEIWTFTSDLITQRPWFGYGLDASRTLGRDILIAGIQGSSLPLHPHNAALHIWLETGFVGVLLFAASLVALGEMLSRLSTLSTIQTLALIWVVVAYASLLVFSYGVWQEWHQASLAMAVAVIRFLQTERS